MHSMHWDNYSNFNCISVFVELKNYYDIPLLD